MRALLLLLVLTGCASYGEPLRKRWSNDAVTMTWVRVPQEQMHVYCPGALACTRHTDVGQCTIYSPEPLGDTDEYRMAILGHEAVHCFFGDFH